MAQGHEKDGAQGRICTADSEFSVQRGAAFINGLGCVCCSLVEFSEDSAALLEPGGPGLPLPGGSAPFEGPALHPPRHPISQNRIDPEAETAIDSAPMAWRGASFSFIAELHRYR
jgi:hypothetical protein